ncbi:PKD-like domain-containing protein [Algoriphagus sp.]|uniref:PKD-like domain-containing protein n=1 Tax=Algoriphagus sp. TaxID=1872435 RepID=UPI003F721E45
MSKAYLIFVLGVFLFSFLALGWLKKGGGSAIFQIIDSGQERSFQLPAISPFLRKGIVGFGLLVGMVFLGGGLTETSAQTVQTFNTPGSQIFVVPVGVTSLSTEVWGGGGGGGGTFTGNAAKGGGGGGGGYRINNNIAVVPGETLTITVGAGGSVGNNQNGQNGGISRIQRGATTLITVNGGTGGLASGNGGTGAVGTINGGNGGNGGASGGGASGTGGNGGNGGIGGVGINAPLVGVGNQGQAPGGGGSGSRSNDGTSRAGGVGGNGRVRISYIQPPPYLAQFISADLGSGPWCPGEERDITVTIRNAGTAIWTNSSPDINIGVKWTNNGDGWFDYRVRTDANNLAPGDSRTYTLTLSASRFDNGNPFPAGSTNNITFDVVNEGEFWFGNNTNGGGPGNFVYTIAQTIAPVADINDMSQISCSGTDFSVTPTNGTNGTIPSGTTYSWTAPTAPNGFVTGGVAGSGSSINGTLVNTSNIARPVVYTITPITNGCPGDPFLVNVLVNPTAAITPISASVCTDDTFTINPVNGTNGLVPSGTTYTWTVPTVTGSVTGGLAGSGTSISGTLRNTGNTPQTATYTVTPITGSCVGSPFTVTVTVNPEPALTAISTAVCSNQTFLVTPVNGTDGLVPAGTTYAWSAPSLPAGLTGGIAGSGTSITGTLTNSTNTPQTATYTVTPTSGSCVGNAFTVTVTVNPRPVIPTQTPTVCSGDAFTVNPSNSGSTNVPANTSYTWTVVDNPNVTGESAQATAQSAISQTLVNASPITQTVTYTVTPRSGTAGNCVGNPFTVTVTVSPKPVLSSPITQVRCSGVSTTYTASSTTPGTSFSWTRPVVAGISNAVGSGSGSNATEILINSTPNPIDVVYVYTLTANGCSNTQNVTVTVNPTPVLSSSLTPPAVCSNGVFTYSPTSSSSGASFTWTRAAVAGVSNAGITSPQTSNPNEILVNTTAEPINVVYAYTSTANGCTNTQDVVVRVNPTPELNSTLTPDAICSNTAFTYTPTSLTLGAIFTWTRATVNGISNAPVTTAQPTNPNEVLVNTTSNPIDVIYAFTISANGCTNTQNVVVSVTPTPTLSSSLTPPAICSDSPFSYNPTSAVSGANFSWTRAAVTGISNAVVTAPQSTNPDEILINTTANPIDVVYTYIISANGCSYTQDVTVTVNPTPTLDSALTPAAVCGDESFTYIPSSATSSAVFTWTRAAVSGISNAAVNTPQTSNPSEVLVNTTQDPIEVIYTYAITANECTNAQIVTVTVHPTPDISPIATSVCSEDTFIVNPLHGTDGVVPTGTTYIWTVADNPNITGASDQNTPQSTISQTLTNTSTTPQDVTYTVTPISGTCVGNPFTVTVTVNGEVSINAQPSDSSPEVCFGDTFPSISVVASGAAGITYQWYSNATSSNSGGTAVPGAASATFTPPSDIEGESYYYVEVIGPCNTVVSAPTGRYLVTPTVITIETPINATAQTICPGSNFTPLFFEALGANLEYKWYSNTTATTTGGTEILGTDSPSFTPANTEFGPVYYYALASSDCGTLTSAVAGPFAITGSSSTASDQTLCVYTPLDPVITHTATGTTGINSDGVAGVNGLPPGISASWSAGVITISGTPTSAVGSPFNYAIPLIGACGTEVATGTINVNPQAEINAISRSICTGGSFNVTPQDGTDGTIPAGTTYQWAVPVVTGGITGGAAGSGTEIVGTLVNPSNSIQTATYNVSPISGTCTGPDFTVTVMVNPTPSLSSTLSPPQICSNTSFIYTPTSAVTGATFTWTRAVLAGISNSAENGSGNINETLINTTSNPIDVIYTYEISANGCTNTQQVAVRVKPTPTLSSDLTPTTICGNSTFSYTPTSDVSGAIFTWTRAAVTGISNPAITNPQSSNPNETLINTTNDPIDVVYAFTISANGCSSTQNLTVTVNPRPILSSTLAPTAICSGATFTYTPTSASPTATFTWTRAAVTGISNAAVTAPQNSNPSEVLQNTTPNAIDVTYVFTINDNGCTNTQNVRVTVKPNPVLNSTLTPPAICSGSTFTYAPTTAISGTSITWTRPALSGISNTAITTPQASNPNETLVNTTAAPIDVVYVYSLTANGCTNTQNVTVSVNPTPTLSSTLTPAAVCSNSAFVYFPTSVTSGASFSWTRAAVAGISNAAGSGSGNINETLVNTTANPIEVGYAYTITANGCSSTQNVTVRVNPTPNITGSPIDITICSGETFNFTPQNGVNGRVPAGTTYTWGVTNNTNIGGESGQISPQTSISQTLTNTTSSIQQVTYTVTPITGSCASGTPFTIVIRVKPRPTVNSITSPSPVCNGSTVPGRNFSGTGVSGFTTIYQWTNSNPSIGLAASGTGNIPSFSAINNGATAATATITVTPMANGCPGTSRTFTITVNPSPRVTIVPDYCVVGGQVQLIANSNLAGTTWLWNTGQTTQSILVDLSGNYAVTATAPNGCTTTESIGVAQELVTDGSFTNFDPNNLTFTTGYSYQVDNPSVNDELIPEGRYGVGTNANNYHPNFWGTQDLTNNSVGPRNMMILNGFPGSNNTTIWQQTVTVEPNTEYYFTASAMSLNAVAPFARLRFEVNGVQVGTVANLAAGVNNNSNNGWQRFYSDPVWNSGSVSGPITIRIVNLEPAAGGNDFALDDISFGTLKPFIVLTSGVGTDNQTVCQDSPITDITYSAGSGIFGPEVNGLPAGVTSVWNGVTLRFSGSPTESGTFNYTITTVGTCVPATATGTITVRSTPNAGVIGADQTVCAGQNPVALSSTQNGTGQSGSTISYLWESNTNVTTPNWTVIPGQTAATYSPPILSSTTQYRRITLATLGGLTCESPPTAPVTVTVQNVPTPGSIAADQAVCMGGDPAPFTSTAAGNGDGTITYRWESAVEDFTSWSTVAGAVGANYDAPVGLSETTRFRRVTISTLNGVACESAPTSQVQVNVNPEPTAGTITSDQEICSVGNPAPFTSTADGTGAGTVYYIWEIAVSPFTDWSEISGANLPTYDPPAGLTVNTQYRRTTVSAFNGVTCESVPTNPVEITILPEIDVDPANSDPILCLNVPQPVTIIHTSTGASGIANEGIPGANGLPLGISAAFNSATGDITISGTPTEAGSFNYTILVTGGCGSVSATGTITVDDPTYPITSIEVDNPAVGSSPPYVSSFTVYSPELTPGDYQIIYSTSGANAITDQTISIIVTTLGQFTFQSLPYSNEGTTILTINSIQGITDQCPFSVPSTNTAPYGINCSTEYLEAGGDASYSVGAGVSEVTIQVFGDGGTNTATIPVSAGQQIFLVFDGSDIFATQVPDTEPVADRLTQAIVSTTGPNGRFVITYDCTTPPPCSGTGDVFQYTDSEGYTVIRVTGDCSSWTWAAPDGLDEFEVLVVGGGGGGGFGESAGGGGGGAVVYQQFTGITMNGLPGLQGAAFELTPGGIGLGATTSSEQGENGGDSFFTGPTFNFERGNTFADISASGGGGGGSSSSISLIRQGEPGASGGGGAAYGSDQSNGGTGTNGNNGGNAIAESFGTAGAGGGGTTVVGEGGTYSAGGQVMTAGSGGNGEFRTISGEEIHYGAGGGGTSSGATVNEPGMGGSQYTVGGSTFYAGGRGNNTGVGLPATTFGSGGGAGRTGGSNGFQGVVYIRYPNFRILPVEYLYFRARYNTNQRSGTLTWATAKEWENDRFEIERAVNGIKEWVKIDEVAGSGYSEAEVAYNYSDRKLPTAGGNIFYRLKQFDFDGDSTVSETRAIQVPPTDGYSYWRVFPNPTSGDPFNLELIDNGAYKDESVTVRIITVSGQFGIITSNTVSTLSLQISEWLRGKAAGVYTLEISWGNKKEYHKVILTR